MALPRRDRPSYILAKLSFCLAVLLAFQPCARALVTFNWPNNGWTAGTPAAGATASQNFTSVTTNDINVAITNGAGSLGGVTFANNYPQISKTPDTGGGTPNVNGLQLLLDGSTTGSYVRTTITFAGAVTNLTITLWDVDANPGQFIDQLTNIRATAMGGGTIGATTVSSAQSGFNTITGTGLSTVVTGTADADNHKSEGSIIIVFNTPVTQFSFDWSNNDAALGAQGIAISQLTYNLVPEAGSFWSTIAWSVTLVVFQIIQIRKKKRGSFSRAPLRLR